MYNESRKKEYLSTVLNEHTKASIQRIFNVAEELENISDKDLCDFSKGDALFFLEEKTSVGDSSVYVSLIKSYGNWCLDKGLSYKNNWGEIKSYEIDDRRKYRRLYLRDLNEFEEMTSIVYKQNAEYNKTVQNSNELCVRLCYQGLEDEEIAKLKKTDIDYENGVIRSPIYEDIIYKVNEKTLALCRYCSEQTSVSYPSNYGVIREERLCDNDYVIRARIGALRGKLESDPVNTEGLVSRKVKRFCNKYTEETGINKDITATKLRESALFHAIRNAEDKDDFMNNGVQGELRLKNPSITNRQLGDNIRRIKTAYHKWSEAFEYPDFNFKQYVKNKKSQDVFEKISEIVENEREKKQHSEDIYLRNRALVENLKRVYGYRCQLCKQGEYFNIQMDEKKYVEVHHIRPNADGVDEEGTLDRPGNLMVLCPNHHKYLHYNQGGNYRLIKEEGRLYLTNDVDRVEVQKDIHLKKYGLFNE